jgi:preprotein translocase subunit YajC
MLINQAFAQISETAAPIAAAVPDTGNVILWNIGFVAVMVGLFYLLLIRPQQSRYREHANMLKALKKGDKVVLQSGMIATIHEIQPEGQEAVVDLYEGVRSRVMRSAIAGKYEDIAGK